MKRLDIRNRVPVTETNIRSPFVSRFELVEEQSKFRFGGEAASFDSSICG